MVLQTRQAGSGTDRSGEEPLRWMFWRRAVAMVTRLTERWLPGGHISADGFIHHPAEVLMSSDPAVLSFCWLDGDSCWCVPGPNPSAATVHTWTGRSERVMPPVSGAPLHPSAAFPLLLLPDSPLTLPLCPADRSWQLLPSLPLALIYSESSFDDEQPRSYQLCRRRRRIC